MPKEAHDLPGMNGGGKLDSARPGVGQLLGQYMMTQTPARAITPPMRSYLSGVILSTCYPHRMESAMKTPPYAA